VRHDDRRSGRVAGRGGCRAARDRQDDQGGGHRQHQGDAGGYQRREPPVLPPHRTADWDFDGRGHDRSFTSDQDFLGRYGELMAARIGAST
jgi:hypothetical protein